MKTYAGAIARLSLCCAAACASTTPPPAATPATAESAPAGRAAAPEAAATPPPARSPDAPLPLRSHSAILGDAIKAMGSAEAWNAHKTLRMTLEMTFQGLGITGTGERTVTATDKSLVVTNIPGVGVIREGSNGITLWSSDPINGVRTLEGAEAEQARADSVWNPELRINDLYRKVEAKNEPGPDGKMLECLVLTPKSAPTITKCYDPVTHLQVLEKGTRATPQGDTPFTSTLSDWREVGGLKMAHTVLTRAGPVTFKGTLKAVTFDVPVEDKMFEPPVPEAAPAGPSSKPAGKAATKPKATKPKAPKKP